MMALTVAPGKAGSAALEEAAEPALSDGGLLIETAAIGVCGTDREILAGRYGAPPPGRERLILGHESLGRVLEAPAGSGFARGDLVAGVVRRPDPEPCECCARGEWDMCRNGRYTERGILGLDGFASERFRLEPAFAVKIDVSLGELGVLLEPASIVAKAWEQLDRIAERACFRSRQALITGAGPIGLLAALLASQRGLEVHVVDRDADGPKPGLVRDLGGEFHAGLSSFRGPYDMALECTGAAPLVMELMFAAGPGSVLCLTGVSSGRRCIDIDAASLNRSIVLENAVVFGTVNANLRHYAAAAAALARADRSWLERLVTRRVPFDRWREIMSPEARGVKTVLTPR